MCSRDFRGKAGSLATERLRGGGHDAISEVSEHLSFASPTAFQRAFRRWTGLAPSAYRQRERRQ